MSWADDLTHLRGPFRRLRDPGPWLIGVALVGLAMRLHLAADTQGTLDVLVWQGHAQEISERGVLEYYRGGRFTFNHPPWMGVIAAGLARLAHGGPFSFELLLRAPFALLDAGTAVLLAVWLGHARSTRVRRARYVLASLYWLSPLAAILSAYHGNTDAAVGFFLVLAALLASRDRPVLCGVALGVSLWVKIPGALAAPLLMLSFPDWRSRARLAGAAAGAAGVGYLPFVLQDPEAVVRAVFLYSGLVIQTTDGTPIWGMRVFLPSPGALGPPWRGFFHSITSAWYAWNTVVCLVPILVLSIARRGRRRPEELAIGITGVYVILYGFSNFWAFQYFAWSLPFWLVCGLRFGLSAHLVATLYVYGLYAWLCDDWLLRGPWRFIELSQWPLAIRLIRNAAVLFFFGGALYFVWGALSDERARWRANSGVG